MKTSASRPLTCNGGATGSSRAQTFVSTFDKHSLFVWRAGEEIFQPLNLHHTKPYTVRYACMTELLGPVCIANG
jgi:NET1-associated nuclear protein 1 (U3 small nucleolar RNA-associated protein 17)